MCSSKLQHSARPALGLRPTRRLDHRMPLVTLSVTLTFTDLVLWPMLESSALHIDAWNVNELKVDSFVWLFLYLIRCETLDRPVMYLWKCSKVKGIDWQAKNWQSRKERSRREYRVTLATKPPSPAPSPDGDGNGSTILYNERLRLMM